MSMPHQQEEARLEMQRRSLGMLQKALLKAGDLNGAAGAAGAAGAREHSLDDESHLPAEETEEGSAGKDVEDGEEVRGRRKGHFLK